MRDNKEPSKYKLICSSDCWSLRCMASTIILRYARKEMLIILKYRMYVQMNGAHTQSRINWMQNAWRVMNTTNIDNYILISGFYVQYVFVGHFCENIVVQFTYSAKQRCGFMTYPMVRTICWFRTQSVYWYCMIYGKVFISTWAANGYFRCVRVCVCWNSVCSAIKNLFVCKRTLA